MDAFGYRASSRKVNDYCVGQTPSSRLRAMGLRHVHALIVCRSLSIARFLIGFTFVTVAPGCASSAGAGPADASVEVGLGTGCGAFGCPDGATTSITIRGSIFAFAATSSGVTTTAGADAGAGNKTLLPGANVSWTPTGASIPVSAMTDSTGAFAIQTSVAPGVDSASISVTASGFAPQMVNIPLKPGVSICTVSATLAGFQPAQTVNSTSPTTFGFELPGPGDTPHPATITIPAGAPPGSSVRVAPMPISAAPGTMQPEGGAPGQSLASLGMFYLEFLDETGATVMPPAGTTVSVGAQEPPSVPMSEPFNAWTLNDQGNWGNPTPMTPPAASSPAPPAPVTSFGYWNADHAFKTACIKGTMVASSNMTMCGGAYLDLTGPDGVRSTDVSGQDGSFCLVGPQGHSGTLAGGQAVSFPATAGNCQDPSSCTDVGMFMVDNSQCDSTPTSHTAADAGCGTGMFTCTDGTCIPSGQVCNGTQNCPDGSDEATALCSNLDECCVATDNCPGETGETCGTDGCCCCPGGQACCANMSGCCSSP
jgi:hypothetical protein